MSAPAFTAATKCFGFVDETQIGRIEMDLEMRIKFKSHAISTCEAPPLFAANIIVLTDSSLSLFQLDITLKAFSY
jgi:hypothetical protein